LTKAGEGRGSESGCQQARKEWGAGVNSRKKQTRESFRSGTRADVLEKQPKDVIKKKKERERWGGEDAL